MKDYAKRKSKSNKTRPRSLPKTGSFSSVLIGLLILGATAAGYFYYEAKTHYSHFNQSTLMGWVSQAKLLMSHHPASQTKLLAKTHVPTPVEKTPEVKFDFYTELSTMKVSLPPPVVPDNSPPPNKSHLANQYLLQLGVFKNEIEAGRARLSLVLMGVDAVVVKNVVHDQTFFRLQQGPYSTLATAKLMQQQLEKKGVTSTIKNEEKV